VAEALDDRRALRALLISPQGGALVRALRGLRESAVAEAQAKALRGEAGAVAFLLGASYSMDQLSDILSEALDEGGEL
jgi:hypothetical protein